MVPCLNDIDEKEPVGREPILGFILADRGLAKVGWIACHRSVFSCTSLNSGGTASPLQQAIFHNRDMANTWFTSDFHFGHFNIIRYCNRPFESTEEMDAHIADRMNQCVKPNDTLYFLGDFCMGSVEKVAAYRKRLNCKTIHFVEGNHDKVTRKSQSVFASWSYLSEIHVGKQGIVLCHYAMRVWPHSGRGAWQLYGHSHGNLPDEPLSLSMDVGVDSHEFCPWHFEEVQAIMKVKATAREQSPETR
jgi:calcineurin-like phosphoesterase family protein